MEELFNSKPCLYKKIYFGSEVYYIRESIYDRAMEEFRKTPRFHTKSLNLTQFSDFVIDKENKFKKCRYLLEQVVDKYADNPPFEILSERQ